MKLDWEIFKDKIDESWHDKLRPFIEGRECYEIYQTLKNWTSMDLPKEERKIILPDSDDTWRVFKETKFKDLKTVWLLQDPYPSIKDKKIVGNGVAMDCRNVKKLQPSLELFYKAINNCYDVEVDKSPSLEYLLMQGCMMLNNALTVEYRKSGSHLELWEPFMKYLFEEVFSKESGLIFVLCGKHSHSLEKYINTLQHYVYKLEHPAFAERQKREWKHENIFKNINYVLKSNNKEEIYWDKEEFFSSVPF